MFEVIANKCTGKCSKKSRNSRRLAIQQLEAKLALSSVPIAVEHAVALNDNSSLDGGYVDVSVTYLNQFSLDIRTDLLPLESLVPNVVAQDSGILNVVTEGLQVRGDSFSGSGFSLSSGGTSGTLAPKVIELPELFPTDPYSGTIAISLPDPFSDPAPSDPTETISESENRSTNYDKSPSTQSNVAGELSALQKEAGSAARSSWQGRSDSLIPSRDRAVSFRIATVAPPQVISPSNRTTHETKDEVRPIDLSDAVGLQRENSANLDTDRAGSSTEVSAQAVSRVDVVESSKAGAGILGDSSFQHRSTNSSSEPGYDGQTTESARREPRPDIDTRDRDFDQEAREHVFAEWRSRDLVAIPAVIALAASPLIHRRRQTCGDTLQLPPRRNA